MANEFGKRRTAKTQSWGVSVPDFPEMRRLFALLGEQDAPFIHGALMEAGNIVADHARRRAIGVVGESVRFEGVSGSGINMKAVVKVHHPAAKSFEFGRRWYYKRATELAITSNKGKKKWFGAYIGNNYESVAAYRRKKGSMKNQTRVRTTGSGFKYRPIMGVLAQYDSSHGWGAIQYSMNEVSPLIKDAMKAEFERIVSEVN